MGVLGLPWADGARGNDTRSVTDRRGDGNDAAGPDPATVDRVARYSGFRPEIQGLRAVAVFMVVLYHIFLGRVSGGVDIFLLISAFFMTLSFVRKLEGGRPLQLGRYWLHTFKRLLPLAVLTVVATLVLVFLFFPSYRYEEAVNQAIATVTYTENWALAFTQVDYYAVDRSTASPFQHFWSLSVQGQVFLLWPLIFGLTWLLTRKTRLRPVPVLAVAFGVVFVASLIFSIQTTATQQEFAYFDTRTRLWEFALGSLLALVLPYLNPPRWLRVVLGWAGLISMILVGLVVDVQGAFPGWIALWPLLSAAAIMIAGRSGSPIGLDRIFASKPLVRLGDASYALYLVHWPLLITYLVLRDRPVAGPRSGVVLILVSLALAILATKLVEKPLKSWKWPEATKPRLAGAILICLLVGLAPAVGWQQAMQRQVATAPTGPNLDNPGAYSLTPEFRYTGESGAETIPLPQQLDSQAPNRGPACPEDWNIPAGAQGACTNATPDVQNPDKTVLLVGNSHAEHWLDAMRPLAAANNWRIVTYIAPGCYFTTAEDQRFEGCIPWLDGADPLIEAVDPDLIVTQSTFTNEAGEFVKGAFQQRLDQLTGQGRHVVGVRDIPRFVEPPSECVMESRAADAEECTNTHPMLGHPDPMQQVADDNPLFSEVDLVDRICPDEQCPPVIGNMYVQWDSGHLSVPYARSLAPDFAQRFTAAVATDDVTVEHAPHLPLLTPEELAKAPSMEPTEG